MRLRTGLIILFCLWMNGATYAELDLEKLPEAQIVAAEKIIQKLDPLIQQKNKEKNLAKMTFEEMYALLDKEEVGFLKEFLAIDPAKSKIHTHWQGLAYGNEELVTVENQVIKKKDGSESTLPPQFVPPAAFKDYEKMMADMKKDLGKRLYIESGYRSSAYQLYLFIFYLKNHHYSIRETAIWNALPGYSEHGNPSKQALDLMNEEGINGENDPESFAVLPEYAWLLKNAEKYSFYLSYPKINSAGIGFEPWHWRYEIKPSQEIPQETTA